MSATGRGTNRDPKDFYATPWAAFAPLLHILPQGNTLFVDPCAGDGRLLRWLRTNDRQAIGYDLYPQKGSTLDRTGYDERPTDFLKSTDRFDFVLTNPPFSLALEFCQHALEYSDEVMFLLRLNFLGSAERLPFFLKHEPDALFVLSSRPSFVMSVTCKSVIKAKQIEDNDRVCKHNWLLPVESPRPKFCPECDGDDLSISTSDNADYAWFYWGDRYKGIHHLKSTPT